MRLPSTVLPPHPCALTSTPPLLVPAQERLVALIRRACAHASLRVHVKIRRRPPPQLPAPVLLPFLRTRTISQSGAQHISAITVAVLTRCLHPIVMYLYGVECALVRARCRGVWCQSSALHSRLLLDPEPRLSLFKARRNSLYIIPFLSDCQLLSCKPCSNVRLD